MRLTVCEMPPGGAANESGWRALSAALDDQGSEWLLLPEMCFAPWLAGRRPADPDQWLAAVHVHDAWIERLGELSPRVVLGSRPIVDGGRFYNEGFVWQRTSGYRAVHRKYYLPDEDGFWEASWYTRGDGDFRVVEIDGLRVGFLICTELWFGARARDYARQGVHLLVCPRATPAASTDKWIAGGVTAAVVAGAYCVSSNLNGPNADGPPFGGSGWVIEPEDGRLLAVTTGTAPLVTVDLDPAWAEQAKHTYPRYVRD